MIDSVSDLSASKHESSAGPQGQEGQKGETESSYGPAGQQWGAVSSLAGSGPSYVEFAFSPLYLRGFPNGAPPPPVTLPGMSGDR